MVKEKNYNHPEVGVLKEDDIQRMKVKILIIQNAIRKPTKEQAELERKMAEEEKEHKLALAKAKKEQMMKMEEEKKKKMPPNEFEKERIEHKAFINQKAFEVTKQQMDDVKEMNKMVAYAKVATVRERQLEEKKKNWEEYKVQEKKKDKIMELERLKKIKVEEEAEVVKKVEALRGKEVIIDQIKSREIDRLRAIEEQQKEAQLMLQRMKELEKEDQRKLERKKEEQKVIN